MTRVLFDHQKFTTQRYGGISRYFANLLQGIDQTNDLSYQLGLLYSRNHYIQHQPLPALGQTVGKLLATKASLLYTFNQRYSKQLVDKQAYDVFHPTYYDPYFLDTLRKPLVVTIHDLTYEQMPEYFWAQDPLTRQKRLNIDRADAIIAISNATRDDLINCYEVDPAKIHVIYHGIDSQAPVRSEPVANLPAHYLLYVGDRSGYKNFYLFMKAFRELANRYPDLHVVLVGGGNLAVAEEEYILRAGLTDRVRHLNASDANLTYLYQQAQLFVYPSLYEGFGLPILEAFLAGCPMLLSDTACFREVAGDAAVFFEPTSLDDLIGQTEALLNDTTRRAALVEAGKKRLQDFPLDVSVRQTLDLYKSLS